MMENNKILSICCKAEIWEYPEYQLKVCSYCKSKVYVNMKDKNSIPIYE